MKSFCKISDVYIKTSKNSSETFNIFIGNNLMFKIVLDNYKGPYNCRFTRKIQIHAVLCLILRSWGLMPSITREYTDNEKYII